MTWVPMQIQQQWLDTNGDPASGYVLKVYEAGGNTTASIAIDKNGATTVSTITLNADGLFEVSGNEVIPFIDRDYKYSIYRNASDATNNTNAYFGPVDNLPMDSFGVSGINLYAGIFNSDFVIDSGGSRNMTATDFTRKTEFTGSSTITLTIPADLTTAASHPFAIVHMDENQTGGSIVFAAATGVTLEANSSYLAGCIVSVYRKRDNVYKVGGS